MNITTSYMRLRCQFRDVTLGPHRIASPLTIFCSHCCCCESTHSGVASLYGLVCKSSLASPIKFILTYTLMRQNIPLCIFIGVFQGVHQTLHVDHTEGK
jgi:hypothetical protein